MRSVGNKQTKVAEYVRVASFISSYPSHFPPLPHPAMSVDLSHPDIAAACASISNPADPAAWLLLQYASPPSTTQLPQLLLLDSGPLPVLPAWQHHLQTTHQSILFGYAEIAEKGLVLVYLTPDVG